MAAALVAANHSMGNLSHAMCTRNLHGDIDFVAGLIYLPFVVWGAVLAGHLVRVRSSSVESLVLMMATLGLLIVFSALRLSWFFIHCFMSKSQEVAQGWAASSIGTLCLLVFFSAFSVYVFSWARAIIKSREVCLRHFLLWGNVAVYAAVIALSAYYIVSNHGGDYLENATSVDADTIHIIVALCDLLLSIAFAGYGASALKIMRQIREKTRTSSSNHMWRL
jgi:hypothetical protein